MAEIQTAFDLDDDPIGEAQEQQTAALLTQLQINPKQTNEQQMAHSQACRAWRKPDDHAPGTDITARGASWTST